MSDAESRPPPRASSFEDLCERLFVRADQLPGFEECLDQYPSIKKSVDAAWALMEGAIKDDDVVRFEGAADQWIEACHHINELVAEAYRLANTDPELWELRYVKWMTHLTYIRCESLLGTFYIVPRRPRIRPKAPYWYTADELADMLHPAIAQVLSFAGALPVRPDSVRAPGRDEKVLHIYGDGSQSKFEFSGDGIYGRTGFRRRSD